MVSTIRTQRGGGGARGGASSRGAGVTAAAVTTRGRGRGRARGRGGGQRGQQGRLPDGTEAVTGPTDAEASISTGVAPLLASDSLPPVTSMTPSDSPALSSNRPDPPVPLTDRPIAPRSGRRGPPETMEDKVRRLEAANQSLVADNRSKDTRIQRLVNEEDERARKEHAVYPISRPSFGTNSKWKLPPLRKILGLSNFTGIKGEVNQHIMNELHFVAAIKQEDIYREVFFSGSTPKFYQHWTVQMLLITALNTERTGEDQRAAYLKRIEISLKKIRDEHGGKPGWLGGNRCFERRAKKGTRGRGRPHKRDRSPSVETSDDNIERPTGLSSGSEDEGDDAETGSALDPDEAQGNPANGNNSGNDDENSFDMPGDIVMDDG
ncbi:hypothetical protein QFC22_006291 [Naganishia vaughanmartiniae]|uniref:Uncharacterized protein n=1 Tax=Naganishia vaughanmartiniae TaxID=1424756 RepID=A0ACC2WMT3_9TREE|nr:hypothetical protein QFC22_006291 [Naganishia vaughanmartiniae]